MSVFDAFHLPGFDAGAAGARWAELEGGAAGMRYPVLTRAALLSLANTLRRNRLEHLEGRAVHTVIQAVDRAAAELTGPGDLRDRALALLPEASRLSGPMAELVLDRMAVDWRADALERLLRAEFRDAALLDRFVDDPDGLRRVRGLGPRLALNIFAGNVPGVAVTALVRCLLVKSAVLGKTAADDPVLAVLFARALERVAPELASCVAVTYWPGGSGEAEMAALEEADTIVVYGGEEAVRAARARAPAGARVLDHGPRMSMGFVGREVLDSADARALARDIALAAATFDQHGCVSLHGAFVERGGAVAPNQLAQLIFEELSRSAAALPPGRLLPDEAARLHAERGRAEFAATADGGALYATPDTAATVVFTERADATPSCLDRFVRICAVDDLEASLATLSPLRPLLQTAGLAVGPARRLALADALARVGFTRIAGFAGMPWPPAHWHHDGASPLRELLRWVDLEDDADRAG